MGFLRALALVLAPPHRAGHPFIAGGLAVGVFGVFVAWPLAVAGLVFALACLVFFRDPERTPPARPAVVAGADGLIVSVEERVPPAGWGMSGEARWRVATFLSVLDVHVNRAPAAGRVTRIVYRPGRFLNASLERAGEENESNAVVLRLPDGREMAVVQIAGLIARRIVCALREGDAVGQGDRIGLIRFGSRTDVWLPPGVVPLVRPGQRAVGGETVFAELG